MLIIAFLWIFISISFWGWGRMFAAFFGSNAEKQDFSETGYFFMGLAFAGILSGIMWLFFPISPVTSAFILGGGLGYAFACLPASIEINFRNPWLLSASLLFALAILMKSAAPTDFYDCGLYYVQTVRWIQAFPVVPGLANLHIRFGNASAWHILGASFDWPFLWNGNFDDLGELVMLWFVVFHGWNALKVHGFERYVSLGLIGFAIIQSQSLLSAPSPDLASGLLGMQTLWQFRKFLRTWNPRQVNQLNTRGLALFVQSLFLAQVKLSAVPFLIIAVLVLFLVLRERWYKMVLVMAGFGVLVAGSMISRSYILTGHLLFPVLDGNFSPDWKVIPAEVEFYLDCVRAFARHNLSVVEMEQGRTYKELSRLSFIEWFPIWATDRKWNEWVLILFAVSGWLLLVRYASSHVRKSFRSHWPLIFFTWLSGMMLLFWFSNAPDVRFGMAILGIGFSFTFASITEFIRNKNQNWNSQLYAEVCLVVFSVFAVWHFRDFRALKENLIFPPKYVSVPLESYSVGKGNQVFKPKSDPESVYQYDQCWGSQIPCSPNVVPGLKLRGKSLQEGFRIAH